MSTSPQRLLVSLDEQTRRKLERIAAHYGLGLAAAVRMLIGKERLLKSNDATAYNSTRDWKTIKKGNR